MKKSLSVLAIILLSTSLFAFEWGGIIGATEYTEDAIDSLSFKQYADADLWFRANFGENLYLSGDMFYSFDYDFASPSFSDGCSQKLDLNSFTFRGNFDLAQSDWNLAFSLGRFNVSDITSLVLAQKIDGAGVSFTSQQSYSIKLYGGYTGLLNSQTVTMYSPDYTAKNTILYSFAVPYAIAGLNAQFTSLFANQNFSLEAITALDAQDFSYNRAYVDLSLDGPIYKSLYYAMATSFALIFDNSLLETSSQFSWGNLSKAEIMYFFNWNSLVVDASVVYITDDFTSITSQEATAPGDYYDSIAKAGLTASAKFFNVLFLAVGCDAVFEVSSYIPSYSGVQYDVSLRYKPLDDLQIATSVSQFFYADANKPSYLCAKGSVKLSF